MFAIAKFLVVAELHCQSMVDVSKSALCIIEVGRYIENIVDISQISIYRYRSYRHGYFDISATSEISVIFGYFIILYPTF